MARVFVFKHPVIQHKLSILRNKKTPPGLFRQVLKELSMLVCYEATRNMPVKEIEVKTPLGVAKGKKLEKNICLVPILRAGLTMADGILEIIPDAKVGFLGLYRDEKTLRPVEYFVKLPRDIKNMNVILLDPMIATGYSMAYSIEYLNKKGIKNIVIIGLIASSKGLNVLKKYNVDIFVAAIDKKLNSRGYIIPGLGDCGDRIFGTR